MADMRSSLASTGDETRHYYFITLKGCINAMISTKAAFIQSTSIQLCAALMILDSLDQHHSDEYWAKSFTDIADDAPLINQPESDRSKSLGRSLFYANSEPSDHPYLCLFRFLSAASCSAIFRSPYSLHFLLLCAALEPTLPFPTSLRISKVSTNLCP